LVAVFAFSVLLVPAALANAQTVAPSPEYVRENWTVADGLPINTITSLVQTRDGYLWLGTNDGVVRFDGVRFTVFNAGNTPGLPGNRIVSLYEDRTGALWIITEQGHLVRYLRGRFTHVDASRGLRSGASRLAEMPDGTLVLSTSNGAGIVHDARYTPVVDAPSADTLQMEAGYGGAVRRRDGSLWIASRRRGLWRLTNGHLDDVTPPMLRGAEILRLTRDPRDRLWVSTTTSVWIEDGGFREVRRPDGPPRYVIAFRYDPRANRMWMIGRDGVDVADGPVSRAVSRFARVSTLLWPGLTLDSAGTAWYADGPELFHDGHPVTALGGTLGNNMIPEAIMSVAIDREGSIWLGTRSSGLYRLKPSLFSSIGVREGLGSGNVYPVYEDTWGNVWVGALEAGVSRIDRVGGAFRVTNFPPPPVQPYRSLSEVQPEERPPNPRDFISDRPDRLWVAALDGIRSCTIPAFRCTYDRSPALANFLDVHALGADAQGRLWAGAANGVLRYDNGQWQRVAGWPLLGLQVRAFVNTPDGALWIATGGGGVVRHKNGRFTQVSVAEGLPGDVVRALHVDAEGYLWVGTEGRGLARLDPRAWGDSTRSRRIAHIGTANGLYDDAIHRILADDADRLWMNSNRGIFWVPRTELVAFAEGRTREVHSTAYTERDGLRNREGNGGVGSAGTRTKDGRLWFPTQAGVAIVDPRVVTARRVTPPVVIERVVAGDSAIVPSGAPIEVGVRGRNLTIEYTALSLLEPKNLRFRYRLEPYDADWVDAGSRRTAFYTRVPPGAYTFRVQAASPEAEFASLGGELRLSLAFEPWETRTFRFGAILLLLAAAAGGAVLYTRRVRQRAQQLELVVADRTATLREREQQLALQNERLSEVDRAKSRFFANVSHEFRTPLTLILGPLRSLLEGRHGPLAPSVREQGDLMMRNAGRLLRMINQILDLARLEDRAMPLERRRGDLVAFARSATLAFAPLADRRGTTLRFHSVMAQLPLAFDEEQLEKVLVNLLSNALKFTEASGTIDVDVGVAVDGATAVLTVRDTGIGIAPEELPRVFERFYQADSSATRRYEGTGIGLSLAKELVELHGGELSATSAPGVGSTLPCASR
jgi:signal transduction histidine kinase